MDMPSCVCKNAIGQRARMRRLLYDLRNWTVRISLVCVANYNFRGRLHAKIAPDCFGKVHSSQIRLAMCPS